MGRSPPEAMDLRETAAIQMTSTAKVRLVDFGDCGPAQRLQIKSTSVPVLHLGDAGRDKLQVVQEGERERQHKRDAADRESTIHIPIYGLGPQDGWNGGRYRGTARWIRALATR